MLPSGDAWLAESFSVHFRYRDKPGAMITCCYYAAVDLDDFTTFLEQQTELCTEPTDPGGSEVWFEAALHTLVSELDSVEAAAAKRAAAGHLAGDEPWTGRPHYEPNLEGNLVTWTGIGRAGVVHADSSRRRYPYLRQRAALRTPRPSQSRARAHPASPHAHDGDAPIMRELKGQISHLPLTSAGRALTTGSTATRYHLEIRTHVRVG